MLSRYSLLEGRLYLKPYTLESYERFVCQHHCGGTGHRNRAERFGD
jgi:hypothetical protein